ncbi:hypothetical protein ACTG9Q_24645 [Actinokineospora sp. 24-640]
MRTSTFSGAIKGGIHGELAQLDATGDRPPRVRDTAPSEFAVWGTHGPRALTGESLPGNHLARPPRNRWHGKTEPH